MPGGTAWTPTEDAIVTASYRDRIHVKTIVKRLRDVGFNRTRSSGSGRACGLGMTEYPTRSQLAVLRYYADGWSDNRIARKTGIGQDIISRARKQLGLPPHYPRFGRRIERKTMADNGMPQPGDRVFLNVPENSRLHNAEATIWQVEDWGAHVVTQAAATGKFRAVWTELVLNVPKIPTAKRLSQARESGYEGVECSTCGQLTVRRKGVCLSCDTCGQSTGGCD